MPDSAHIRQLLAAIALGCALGYLLSRHYHPASVDELAEYRQVARDARRVADGLRAAEHWRTP